MENYDDLFNGQEPAKQSAEREDRPFDMEEYKNRKRLEREEAFGLIEDTAGMMQNNGEMFQTYLDVQARFDRFSVSNALLITAQIPEARGPFKSFDDWKKEGIYINKGESGIYIMEPGKEYTRRDGSTGVNYNVKRMFDVSQTRSRTPIEPAITRDERLLLKSLITDAPCKIAISDQMSDRVNAVYKADEKTIYVRPGMDGPSIFKALSQELAHAHMDRKGSYRRSESMAPAYCVSYLLCKRYGIPADTYRFSPMAEQYSKMSPKEFRAELSRIRNVAGEISRDMNRILEAQERGQKNRANDAR